MKKQFTFLLLALGALLSTQAQDLSYDWHTTEPGWGFYIAETEVVDTVIYTIISATHAFDADPTSGIDSIYPTSIPPTGYPSMIVLAKMSTSGNYLGSKLLMQQFVTYGDIGIFDMKISHDGKVILAGYTRDTTINFNPTGTPVGIYSSTSSVYDNTKFVAFYDLNGNYVNHLNMTITIMFISMN